MIKQMLMLGCGRINKIRPNGGFFSLRDFSRTEIFLTQRERRYRVFSAPRANG